ncbi:MAG: type II toxin-antitoxin system VapC family toxin [Pseudomonadota bacterium]
MPFIVPQNELILLDTCILVHVCRGKKVGRRIMTDQLLKDRSEKPLICVVTVGEALSLAKQFNWGAKRQGTLIKLMSELVIADIYNEEVLNNYAEIDHYLKKVIKPAHPIGKNDIWIAATARTADAWLLTSDKHFNPLDSQFIKRVYIDPDTGESSR